MYYLLYVNYDLIKLFLKVNRGNRILKNILLTQKKNFTNSKKIGKEK